MGKRRKNTGVTNSTPPTKKSTTNAVSDNEADQLPKWEAYSRNVISLLSHIVRQQQVLIDSMNKDVQQQVSDVIAAEKRSRTIVFRGAAESKAKKPSDRVVEDTALVMEVLDEIGVAVQPTSTFRMGKLEEGKPRLLMVEFPNRMFVSDVLRTKASLRESPSYSNLFLDRSKTKEQLHHDYQQRCKARATSTCQPDPMRATGSNSLALGSQGRKVANARSPSSDSAVTVLSSILPDTVRYDQPGKFSTQPTSDQSNQLSDAQLHGRRTSAGPRCSAQTLHPDARTPHHAMPASRRQLRHSLILHNHAIADPLHAFSTVFVVASITEFDAILTTLLDPFDYIQFSSFRA
ncbi:hypothetical protein AAVH_43340 [Aphelenchoides avenae]|nr:hypothetical protein AAVH_43340 [Aphelenchus avenae]